MIEIALAAPLMTVQDLGRHHWRHLGVPRAGMMDNLALEYANMLLGNPAEAAGIEITFGPAQLATDEALDIVLMGADMRAQLLTADRTIRCDYLPPGFVHRLPPGHILSLQTPRISGQRSCLAVAGGVDVAPVLGSRSTDLLNGFGGLQGRVLQTGDRLAVGNCADTSAFRSGLRTAGIRQRGFSTTLRATRSTDYDDFDARAQSALWQTPWVITPLSNRMGLRLSGVPLLSGHQPLRRSAGVLPGMIQVPSDGQPIILANDAQTTGGYPCVVSIIGADLWQLAYLTPGTEIRFREVSVAEAQGLASLLDRDRDVLAMSLAYLRNRQMDSVR